MTSWDIPPISADTDRLIAFIKANYWDDINWELDDIIKNGGQVQLDLISQNIKYGSNLDVLIWLYRKNPDDTKIQYVMDHLKQPLAQDFLANEYVRYQDSKILKVCLQNHYLPRDPARQALFYILSGQWEAYEALDSDHDLLKAALQKTDKTVLDAVVRILRQAGRSDLMQQVVTSLTQPNRISQETDAFETDFSQSFNLTTFNLLAGEKRYSELWEWVPQVCAYWSKRIVRYLAQASWEPTQPEAQWLFKHLSKLSSNYPVIQEQQLLSKVESTTRFSIGPFPDQANQFERAPDFHAVEDIRGIAGAKLSPDALHLAKACVNSDNLLTMLEIWDVVNQQILTILDLTAEPSFSNSLELTLPTVPILNDYTYSSDGKFLACVASLAPVETEQAEEWPTGVWIYSLPSYQCIEVYRLQSKFKCNLIRFSPDNKTLLLGVAAGFYTRGFELYRWQSNQLRFDRQYLANMPLTDVAFHPDQDLIVAGIDGTASSSLVLLSLPDLKEIQEVDGERLPIFNARFSPDGKILAYGRVFRWLNLNELEATKKGDYWATALAFRADSRLIAVGSRIQSRVSVWDIENEFQCDFDTLSKDQSSGNQEAIIALEFSRDGKKITSVNNSGEVTTRFPYLLYLYTLPAHRSSVGDFLWAQRAASDPNRSLEERNMCEFIAAHLASKWQYEVEVAASAELAATAHDIELGDDPA